MDTDSSLKSVNTIAYDKPLREKLDELHASLGEGITDIAAAATEFSSKYKDTAIEQLKFMSKLTADLSVALIHAADGKQLNTEEQKQFDAMKNLADSLGNLQFKINRLIMDVTNMEKLSEQIAGEGLGLLDGVMDVQAKLTEIRVDINDLGIFSNNPEMSYLFDKQHE